MNYPDATTALENQLKKAPATHMTELSTRLIEGAKNYDNFRIQQVINDPEYVPGVTKNFNDATHFVADFIKGADFADDLEDPLGTHNEAWNKGKRQALAGDKYDLNTRGFPINPYLETGIAGVGVIGKYGANHAVDVGLLNVEKDSNGKLALHAYGILKGKKPFFCGGFAEYEEKDQDGFIIGRNIWIANQCKEFFEEMVSGSIKLFPEFSEHLDDKFHAEISKRVKRRDGIPVPEGEYNLVRKQTETELKIEQVAKYDPEFFTRLRKIFDEGQECYRGPVRSSTRNTDNAWMETYLSWVLMDNKAWNFIVGDEPVFDYRLAAGDDADGVKAHRIDRELLDASTGTHSAMFTFMAAAYVLDQQDKGHVLNQHVESQLKEVATYLEKIPQTNEIKYSHLRR